jgi:two-component system, OmpR family, sensor histidine kinase MprB
MSTPATETTSGVPARDERRWHYRRSLASRVVLLTTMAVGLAVAFVALGAFLTVRMSMQSSLDSSLLDRAHQATNSATLAELTRARIPTWQVGAADVRIFYIDSKGNHTTDPGPSFQVGAPELAVASGDSTQSVRTISSGSIDYRVVAVPAGGNVALVLAQNVAPQERVRSCCSSVSPVSSVRQQRAGPSRATGCDPYAASPTTSR